MSETRNLNVQKLKALFDRMVEGEDIHDLREGVGYIWKAKEKFLTFVCRVFDLDFGEETTRTVPDPFVDRLVTYVKDHPEEFT